MTDTVNVSRELLRQVLRGLRMCDQQNQVLDDTYTALRAALEQPTPRVHATDDSPCWCNPETVYIDPDTGTSVIVHKEPQ